ncbi:four helix bundle protein [soil metagenome]
MTKLKGYKDLIVWQKSLQLVVDTYMVVGKFPKEELYSLTSQLKRCSVSVPSNIAEGWARGTDKQFVQFLNVARCSLAELETQIEIAKLLNFINAEDYKKITTSTDEIGRMINSLVKVVKQRNKVNTKGEKE